MTYGVKAFYYQVVLYLSLKIEVGDEKEWRE